MVSGISTRMTTQRLARASRSRFFIGLGILILTVGFVAIFHSSQQELDQLRQMEQRCEQQQHTLTEQLTAFELTVKVDRTEHEHIKLELQRRNGEMKEFRDKTLMESNMKFGAMQQSYKLLKIQNDDLADECQKLRTTHLEQLSALETKLKNIAAQQEQILRQKDRAIDDAQVKVNQLEARVSQLLTDSGGQSADEPELRRQLQDYHKHCAWRPAVVEPAVKANAQPVDGSHNGDAATGASDVAGVAHNFNAQHRIIPKPLPVIAEQAAAALKPPAMSSTTVRAEAAAKPKRARQIPEGVVPITANELPNAEHEQSDSTAAVAGGKTVTTISALAAASQDNNRYANVLTGDEAADAAAAGVRPAALDGADAPDTDNGAHEVLDEFLVDGHSMGHKDHMQLVLEDKQLTAGGINNNPNSNNVPAVGGGGGEGNNAAEEDANGTMDGAPMLGGSAGRMEKDENEADNAILRRSGGGGGGKGGVGGARKMPSDQKLLNEIDADQGKVAGYQDDVHLEDVQEEEGDDDEYANPAARNMDPAVRN